jgi:hypothetical protein
MQVSVQTRLILLWLIASLLAVGSCSLIWPAAHYGAEYLPVGNDSVYHARRILDAVADPSAFYQFDPKIHAPEGSIIVWPWGYDYALAWIVRVAMKVGFSGPPIAFLIWIPVAAVLASVALMMVVARRLGLSVWGTGLAGLCVSVSPLTQGLHGVGVIDHHYAEYIFILATIGLGLKWFLKPDDTRAAVSLGAVLGIAVAIHNGLFILQLPVLAAMFLWWLQGIRMPRRPVLWFAGTLLAATLAVLLPSLPFRLMRFEFYTLSWFHLYAALGTAAAAAVLAIAPRTWRAGAWITVAVLIFLLPLGHQVLIAHSFLVGAIKRLDVISEMQSPRQMAEEPHGIATVSVMYSLWLWLWPVTISFCAYRAWKERASGRLFFWVCAVSGLVLLIMQYRMHYYGSFALVLPWLLLAEELAAKREERRKLVMLSTSLVFLLMFSMPLRYSIPTPPSSGGTNNFPALRLVLGDLQKACAKDPGIVLADNDAGHYIRYYTECSVISNNFLLTQQHADKIELSDHLMTLSADELPAAAPYVRYVLIRPVAIQPTNKGPWYVAYSQAKGEAKLLSDLLLKPYKEVSPRYIGLREVDMRWDKDQLETLPLMRLFKVARPGEVAAARGTEVPPVAAKPPS